MPPISEELNQTIEYIRLNHPALQEARKAMFFSILALITSVATLLFTLAVCGAFG